MEKAFLEDEIWARISIDLGSLPLGDMKIIPHGTVARIKLERLEVEDAEATLSESSENLMSYRL